MFAYLEFEVEKTFLEEEESQSGESLRMVRKRIILEEQEGNKRFVYFSKSGKLLVLEQQSAFLFRARQ